MALQLPAMLNVPPKMLPMITEFNNYRFLLVEGGRGSAKTQSIARFLLFLGGQRKMRVVCGREIQNTLEESVHAVLKDLIEDYNLPYIVQTRKIIHKITGTVFTFKGFREQGSVNIKGLEGADIIWIDEAQTVTKNTLDVLNPTVRKNNAKIIFSMNRFMLDDAVPEYVRGRDECLRIEINYNDNPHCPMVIKVEAAALYEKSIKDYNHIYMNIPLKSASDFLFNYEKMHSAFNIVPFGHTMFKRRVMGIDFAAQGDDQCVATILDRLTNQHWTVHDQIAWDEADSTVSIGKIVNLVGKFKPDVTILDVGGMGHVVHDRLTELNLDIKRFDGAVSNDGMVDKKHYVNARANGYYELKEWFEQEFLVLPETMRDTVKELEKIRMKFRSDGRRLLQPKDAMKAEFGHSPDRADSLMMAVWGAVKYLGQDANTDTPPTGVPQRKNITRRTKHVSGRAKRR